MKSVMKLMLVEAILFLITSSAAAQVTVARNAYVDGYFYGTDGSLSYVFVQRSQDPVTQVITTGMNYNWCPQAGRTENCQGGYGVIANSAFVGNLSANLNHLQVLTLSVDTNAIPDF